MIQTKVPEKIKTRSLLQTLLVPTISLFCILCVLILICFYIFRRTGHLQGAYANGVKTYSNKIFHKYHTYQMCSIYLKYTIFKMYYKITV
jgi:hypothetical protein